MKVNEAEAKAIGQRIDAARIDRGLTLPELATRTGVDYSQVFKICKGQFIVISGSVWQICNKLHISPLPDALQDEDERRLTRGVLSLWNRTHEDADRIVKMLHSIRDVRDGS
ncbi:hypothetical protein GCM10007989_20890 [Devosia pacifica]|uniref:HTH cro/C1-type domain-containing protein n=2 Tax=Devosia pacifica TaxID=1335967 RepID=A0A918VUX4_9HYPH|nr:hypothetical protein GCM10007989_20890 [Devosia pacifica]